MDISVISRYIVCFRLFLVGGIFSLLLIPQESTARVILLQYARIIRLDESCCYQYFTFLLRPPHSHLEIFILYRAYCTH